MRGAEQYTKKFTLKMIWDSELHIYSLVTVSVPSRYSLGPFLVLSESGPVQPSQHPSAELTCITPFCWITMSLRIYYSVLNYRPFVSLICPSLWVRNLKAYPQKRKGFLGKERKAYMGKMHRDIYFNYFSLKNIYPYFPQLCMGLSLSKPHSKLKTW